MSVVAALGRDAASKVARLNPALRHLLHAENISKPAALHHVLTALLDATGVLLHSLMLLQHLIISIQQHALLQLELALSLFRKQPLLLSFLCDL